MAAAAVSQPCALPVDLRTTQCASTHFTTANTTLPSIQTLSSSQSDPIDYSLPKSVRNIPKTNVDTMDCTSSSPLDLSNTNQMQCDISPSETVQLSYSL